MSADQSLVFLPLKFFQIDNRVKKEGEGRIKKRNVVLSLRKEWGHCTSLLRNIYLQTFLFNKDSHTHCSKIVGVVTDL